MALVPCKECKKEIGSTASKCPHCGTEQKNLNDKKPVISIFLGIIILGFIAIIYEEATGNKVNTSILSIFNEISNNVSSDSSEVEMVKNGKLTNYPNKTIGEAVHNFFGSPSWEYGVAEDGTKFVNVEGKITYMEKPINAKMQFELDKKNPEQFSIRALEFNELPQNNIMIIGLLNKMFEEDSTTGITGESNKNNTEVDTKNFNSDDELTSNNQTQSDSKTDNTNLETNDTQSITSNQEVTKEQTNDSDDLKIVIRRWQEIKAKTKKDLTTDQYNTILSDKALEDNQNGINWLSENNSYWELNVKDIEFLSIDKIDNLNAVVIAKISEKGDYYHNNTRVSKDSYDKSYKAEYELKKIGNNWYISKMDIIK